MPTLAPKLPYTHPFAGGYPRLGGQSLPSDPDAIDYLARVAAADGAAVEVGVAMAVDQFIKGCKADSAGYAGDPTRTVWDALKASCIMCGARTIAGALVPLVGAAPTPYNFAGGDYDRSGGGLKGDGATKYLNTNRSVTADPQNDTHVASYCSETGGVSVANIFNSTTGATVLVHNADGIAGRLRNTTFTAGTLPANQGFAGFSRNSSSGFTARASSDSEFLTATSEAFGGSGNLSVFNFLGLSFSEARISFYSIGSALDLAALDNRVTQLVTGIKFHSLTGLVATDYDPDTVAYIVAAYESGGTL